MAFIFNFFGNMMKVHAMRWNGVKGEEYVHRLTGDNAADFIRNNRYVMIFFYSNHCLHCQQLMPQYAQAAAVLNQEQPGVKMTALDAVRYKSAQRQFDLTGTPTVNLYVNGHFIMEYKLRRRAAEIIDFAKRYTTPH